MLLYALLGSFLPYLPVWLSGRGLSDAEVGYVLSTAGVAVMVSPLIMTLVGDTQLPRRTVLAGLYVAAAGGAGLMLLCHSLAGLLLAHLLFAAAITPMMPLGDAVLFSTQASQAAATGRSTPYHRVRAFGTAGFLLPALGLWAYLHVGGGLDAVLVTAGVVAVLGALNATTLPRGGGREPDAERPEPAEREAKDARSGSAPPLPCRPGASPTAAGMIRGVMRLPTAVALGRLMRPDALVFAAAMWLLYATISAYYGFYPLLLTRPAEAHGAGLDPSVIGLVSNLGVAIELPFMLAFGLLLRRAGLRRFMALGAALIALRMAMLAVSAVPVVAIGSQLLHGVMVLVVHVAPPVFFNRFAEERYRASLQGLYVVVITGTARIVGSVTAGQIADVSLRGVFLYATAMALAAALGFAFLFRPRGEAAGEAV